MRYVLSFACLLVLIAPATAQDYPPDTIGLWFDEDYSVPFFDPPIGVPFDGYLVLHNPSAGNMTGIEFHLEFTEDNVIMPNAAWGGDPISVGNPDCTIMGYSTPFPLQPITLLATLTFVTVADIGECQVIMDACAGEPCPRYQSSFTDYFCLSTLFNGGIIGCIGDCVVATEATTWSAVKSLYR